MCEVAGSSAAVQGVTLSPLTKPPTAWV
jgi:hypothetical protein